MSAAGAKITRDSDKRRRGALRGPFVANDDHTITYRGNNVFPSIADISSVAPPVAEFANRVLSFRGDPAFAHAAWLNHQMNLTVHRFFTARGALFTLLPLTTRMISSPGAVYGEEALDYTTDTCPITLEWFDLPDRAFLSESSQIYLELALAQPGITEVYSVYNSFRLEPADASHLSEFHHVEFEGVVSREENETIVQQLLSDIVRDMLADGEEHLAYFLSAKSLSGLSDFADGSAAFVPLSFADALALLYEDTRDERYTQFTMDETFGPWEEVRLTSLVAAPVMVTGFPLLEVPFYHDQVEASDPAVAANADFIWPGYREIVGSGQRIATDAELERKAAIFNLPPADYEPYRQTRRLPDWQQTCGFGLGWERFIHGLLELPCIWSVAHFPRTHLSLLP